MTSTSHTNKRAMSPAGGDRKAGARGSGSGSVSIGSW
jgi:hypothetical protein